jgi:hypothetical protein
VGLEDVDGLNVVLRLTAQKALLFGALDGIDELAAH